MKKYLIIAVLFLTVFLFCSCESAPLPQTDPETQDTENSAEITTEVAPDPFMNIRNSGEKWLTYGLSAYEKGKKVDNLKDFFSDSANQTYLTLYDHMFTFDKKKSVPVAEAVFAFICDEYGVDALVDIDKRCEYKTAYLQSLGLDTQYVQSEEIEKFFISMDFSSNSTYKYIISFGKVTYYFKDFTAGSPTQYHGFMYYSTTGLFDMIEYMKANNLSDGLDTERKFDYYMTFDGSGYSITMLSNGKMYINDSYSALHEAVHAMGINNVDNIWLTEGICNYFGKTLGFNSQIALSYIQILTMAKQGYFDDRANAGDKQAILYKKVYEDYTACGGTLDSVDTFDFRIYADVAARAELDSNEYTSLGEAYKIANKKECNSVGEEISYDQATSLILYLEDTYGIQNLLEAYRTQNIESVFGKDYESLKSDWLEYLYK